MYDFPKYNKLFSGEKTKYKTKYLGFHILWIEKNALYTHMLAEAEKTIWKCTQEW